MYKREEDTSARARQRERERISAVRDGAQRRCIKVKSQHSVLSSFAFHLDDIQCGDRGNIICDFYLKNVFSGFPVTTIIIVSYIFE